MIVKIGIFILIIAIGIIRVRKSYVKFTDKEKSKIKKEMRHPFVIFDSVFYLLGLLFLLSGTMFDIKILLFFAFLSIGIGFIMNGAYIWKADHKSGFLLLMICSATALTTSLLTLKTYWF